MHRHTDRAERPLLLMFVRIPESVLPLVRQTVRFHYKITPYYSMLFVTELIIIYPIHLLHKGGCVETLVNVSNCCLVHDCGCSQYSTLQPSLSFYLCKLIIRSILFARKRI